MATAVDLNCTSFKPFVPTFEEATEVLKEGLKKYFHDVEVSIVDTPDFNQKPFCVAVQGLHGKTAIADVGGVHNLIPRVNLNSKYSLQGVVESIYQSREDYPVSIFGPGGGSFEKLGYCCEFMGSARYESSSSITERSQLISCCCRYAYVDEDGKGHWLEQKGSDAFGLMGNFFLSQNKPGKLLKVHVKKRLDGKNYTEAIREVLLQKYGKDKPVSMGGVFLINKGSAKLHIMPKYWPDEPSTDESVNKVWLKYYEIKKHPLVCLSVFHSSDPGFGLRMEHTHCFNLDEESEAGHYHYDVTPDTIEYEGYFNFAQDVYRVFGPENYQSSTCQIGE